MTRISRIRCTAKVWFFLVILSGLISLNANWGKKYHLAGGDLFGQVFAAATAPELPRVYLNTDYVQPTGRTITVNAGGDLQTAINQSQPGDVISLQAGATFTGNFTLPTKSGQGWIIIRSSTADTNLPPPGTRITPQFAGVMPKIITPNTGAALLTAAGAHHYRLIGLEIGISSGVALNYGIVTLGEGSSQDSLSKVPQDIIIDRCYIHGNSAGDVSRGIALNSGRTAVIDSFISECHGVGFDTQAICGWNGPGPFKIVNNYLEGAGENFMLGGAGPSIAGLVPEDVEFRNNYLYKPLRWKADDPSYTGTHWSVKNLFELKNARRVLVEGNVLEHNWVDAQNGYGILFTPRNEGTPGAMVEDVTFVNNILRHSAGGINILGKDNGNLTQQGQRLIIRNNLFIDIGGTKWGQNGTFLQIAETPDVVVDHNTVIHTGNVITAYGPPSLNFVFTNNILQHNLYGVKGDGVGTGNDTINVYFPGVIFTRNVLAGGSIALYPSGNFFPTNLDAVGFVDLAGGNYSLSSSSPYRNAGTDGQDLGYLTSGGSPSPTPTPTPTTVLTISNVTNSSISTTGSTITWTTSMLADSQIEYGLTTAYGQQTPLNSMMMTTHLETLTGLTANTLYNYRVKSRNSSGTLAVSSNYTFRTASSPTPTPTPTPSVPPGDTLPPVISGVLTTAIDASAADIIWETNEIATSQIEYGVTTAYGQVTLFDSRLVLDHAVELTDLEPDTLYNYRVKSSDGAGNLTVSQNFTFVTKTSITGGGIPIAWTNLKGLVVIGSDLMKVSGCDGCPATANSMQSIASGDGYVEFVAAEVGKEKWIGLIKSGKTLTTFRLDFALMLGDEAAVFERGRYKTEVMYSPGDIFRISIEKGTVRYYRNGLLFYTSSSTPLYPMVLGAYISKVGGTVRKAMIFTNSLGSSSVQASARRR